MPPKRPRKNPENCNKPPEIIAPQNKILDDNPNSEVAQKIELELCWCIQQLQTALKSNKLNQKQVEENTKSLNILMNNNAPLVKKRQIMRLTFGDYRAKMLAEEKKFHSVTNKMQVKPIDKNKKSVFIKKSIFSASNEEFLFNFPKQESSELPTIVTNISEINLDEKPSEEQANFLYVPSDNSFKFNFETVDDKS